MTSVQEKNLPFQGKLASLKHGFKSCRRTSYSEENEVFEDRQTMCAQKSGNTAKRSGQRVLIDNFVATGRGGIGALTKLVHIRKFNLLEFAFYLVASQSIMNTTPTCYCNWNTIGCSMLIGPDGEERLSGPYGAKAEKILYHTIKPTPRPARGAGWSKFKPDSK